MSGSSEAGARAGGLTLVCFALPEEATAFRKLSADRDQVAILVTGIGKQNARKSTREFLSQTPVQTVFTCGFAGGLNPNLKVGDVVFAAETLELRQKLEAAGAKPATFHCADRIAVTAIEKTSLRASTGADAVEMESESIREVCRERGIPCATIRVISDAAGDDLPLDFNQLAKPDQNLDYRKLAWAIARSPGKIAALLELQKRTRKAGTELARVLAQIV